MCHRRKLDGPEALVEEARRAGLDDRRFRIDLESNAILEGFGADLEETRALGDVTLPLLRFLPEQGGGERRVTGGRRLRGTGARRRWKPARGRGPARFRTSRPRSPGSAALATAELAAVCDLPGPRAGAEVWRLASEWRVARVPVLFGELWEGERRSGERRALRGWPERSGRFEGVPSISRL